VKIYFMMQLLQKSLSVNRSLNTQFLSRFFNALPYVTIVALISLGSYAFSYIAKVKVTAPKYPADRGSDPVVPTNSKGLNLYPDMNTRLTPEVSIVRNPFSSPSSARLDVSMPAPNISLKGFAGLSGLSQHVFLSVDGARTYQFRVGQEIGNGFRIVAINSTAKNIIVSNGRSRFKYQLKDL